MLSTCSSAKLRLPSADASRRYMSAHVSRTRVRVVCQSVSTWDSWSSYLQAQRNGKSAALPNTTASSQLASEVATAAKTFKPRFGGGSANTEGTKKKAAPKQPVASTVPSGLQKKLDAIGKQGLSAAVGKEVKEAASLAYTTTEFGAAISMTSVVVDKDGEKTAVIVFLATEVERGVSWSRLEGLILHWACSDKSGGAWSMPPEGWSAVPNKNVDASGAWNSSFEKFVLEGGNDQSYRLVLQLPLRGVLKSGGVTFVLKATQGQNTRWLKDSSTEQDFYLDLQSLPTIKA